MKTARSRVSLTIIFSLVVITLIAGIYSQRGNIQAWIFEPRATTATPGASTTAARTSSNNTTLQPPQTPISKLSVPWEVTFLPDETLLVTERSGQLLHIRADSEQRIPIAGVRHVGEGGLLGLALHPSYSENGWLYLYLTTQTDTGLTNRVERYTYDEQAGSLSDRMVIIENIPGSRNHDGGRIAFGPDNHLYITTGDGEKADLAQDTNSLAGKVLRVSHTGAAIADNPFGNQVYSYGHRNPQGLAWDEKGRLWLSEHGPSGTNTGNDEINLIVKGGNYGWPEVQGDQKREGMIPPVLHSGTADTWAPADIAVKNGRVYFTGLRAEALFTAQISEDTGGVSLKNLTAHYRSEFGRLRAVTFGPDELLYLTTSNTDGRGTAAADDDRIITLSPELLTLE